MMAIRFLTSRDPLVATIPDEVSLHWQGGDTMAAKLQKKSQWASLRVREDDGVLLPVAFDTANLTPYTNPDWRLLVALTDPSFSAKTLSTLFKTLDVNAHYPHSEGLHQGWSSIQALVRFSVLPADRIHSLVSIASKRFPVASFTQRGHTLVDAALSRNTPLGLVLAECFHQDGLRQGLPPSAAQVWNLFQTYQNGSCPVGLDKVHRLTRQMRAPAVRQRLGLAPLPVKNVATPSKEFDAVSGYESEEKMMATLTRAWLERSQAATVLESTIALFRNNAVSYEGPLSGALLQAIREHPNSLTSPASELVRFLKEAPPLNLCASCVVKGKSLTVGDVLAPFAGAPASVSQIWGGLASFLRARSMDASLPVSADVHAPSRLRM